MNPIVSQSRRTFLSDMAGAIVGMTALPLFGEERTPAVAGIADRLRKLVEDAPLEMQFKEMTADDCRAFQDRFRVKLTELLGSYQPPQEWKTTVLSTVVLEGYRREELLLESEGQPALPLYLLVPDASDAETPTMRPGAARPRRVWPPCGRRTRRSAGGGKGDRSGELRLWPTACASRIHGRLPMLHAIRRSTRQPASIRTAGPVRRRVPAASCAGTRTHGRESARRVVGVEPPPSS